MDNQVTHRVLQVLRERIVAPAHRERISAGTPLLSSGLGLDSVAVLDLVMEVEKEFGVSFDDADLSVELFRSAETLARAVEDKLRAQAGERREQAVE